jgi:hypothetical protein
LPCKLSKLAGRFGSLIIARFAGFTAPERPDAPQEIRLAATRNPGIIHLHENIESIIVLFMPNHSTEPVHELSIALTLVRDEAGNPSASVSVQPTQMIAYDQKQGFTRLRLVGNKVLEVKEGTDQIDWLIRKVASDGLFRRNVGP